MSLPSNCTNIYQVIPLMLNSTSTSSSKSVSSILIASLSPPKLNPGNSTCFGGGFKFPRYAGFWKGVDITTNHITRSVWQNFGKALSLQPIISLDQQISEKDVKKMKSLQGIATVSSTTAITWLSSSQMAYASTDFKLNPVFEVGELFELSIQLSYVLLLLALLGVGTFFVLRQVLVRRELDLSAKELQEQVRSGDANATGLFELGAVMLRRKYYPAATKYLLQAIDKWDGDDQDLAQVYNALGVSYVRDGKLEKGINQFEKAVKLQPGYVTAWNNLGDAYEEKKEYKSALRAFEEALLFDPNNRVARPRVDSLRDRVNMYKGVPVKTKDKSMF